MVTHDPEAAAFADRIVELADGRVVADRRRDGAGPAEARPAVA
jgi:ABC-type lipoprotein export system ATPase subunit